MSAIRKEVVIGECRLLLGDCREILPTLGKVDAVVTDPPYGMNWNTDSTRFSGGQHKRGDGRSNWGQIAGDSEAFDPSPWLAAPECIMWGSNHFGQSLPVGTTLVWMKKAPHLFGTFLSDAEVAWQKGGHGVYLHFQQFPPPSRIAEHDGKTPAHPTQKPLSLMVWCVRRVSAKVILDPFMGSGTTGLACLREGRGFVGIERDETHFSTACERIRKAYAQPDFFVAQKPAAPVQLSILDGAA